MSAVFRQISAEIESISALAFAMAASLSLFLHEVRPFSGYEGSWPYTSNAGTRPLGPTESLIAFRSSRNPSFSSMLGWSLLSNRKLDAAANGRIRLCRCYYAPQWRRSVAPRLCHEPVLWVASRYMCSPDLPEWYLDIMGILSPKIVRIVTIDGWRSCAWLRWPCKHLYAHQLC